MLQLLSDNNWVSEKKIVQAIRRMVYRYPLSPYFVCTIEHLQGGPLRAGQKASPIARCQHLETRDTVFQKIPKKMSTEERCPQRWGVHRARFYCNYRRQSREIMYLIVSVLPFVRRLSVCPSANALTDELKQ